jgi:hypothetical protein
MTDSQKIEYLIIEGSLKKIKIMLRVRILEMKFLQAPLNTPSYTKKIIAQTHTLSQALKQQTVTRTKFLNINENKN